MFQISVFLVALLTPPAAKQTTLLVADIEALISLKKALESDQALNWKVAADSEYNKLQTAARVGSG